MDLDRVKRRLHAVYSKSLKNIVRKHWATLGSGSFWVTLGHLGIPGPFGHLWAIGISGPEHCWFNCPKQLNNTLNVHWITKIQAKSQKSRRCPNIPDLVALLSYSGPLKPLAKWLKKGPNVTQRAQDSPNSHSNSLVKGDPMTEKEPNVSQGFLDHICLIISAWICFGVQSIKHANVLSEKNHFSALGGSKVAILGGDDLDPIYFEVHMFLNPPGPPYMSKNAQMCYF